MTYVFLRKSFQLLIDSGLIKRGAVVGFALALGGCAGLPQKTSAPPRQLVVDGLNLSYVNDTLVRGFSEIRDRAYQQPDLDQLFTAALTGLQTIDPAIMTSTVDDHVVVDYQDQRLIDLPPAARSDVAGWSLSTLRTLMAARKTSPLLHAADEEAIYKALFTKALTLIDPYSRYSGRQDAIRNRLVRDGVIGLGVRLELQDDGALVKAIVNEGPADIVGVKIGDIITHANGAPLTNQTLVQVRHRLDGTIGTRVALTIRREGEPQPLEITAALDLVVPDTVTANFNNGVLELKVSSFNQRTALAVEKAVVAARDGSEKLKGIVLDLRGDPGGLLDQAVDMADLFLETGTIASLHGRHPGANQYYAAKPGDIVLGTPLAVIIDGKSASAAEIVAAALQDNHRAAVVGTVSWGKGSVQTLRKLPNGGEIALTWSRVVVPRGVALHGLGLMPDVCTSGAPATVGEILEAVSVDTRPGSAVRREWKDAADDVDLHTRLRTECPAEAHPDYPLDLEVARRIVSDQQLFVQAVHEDTLQFAAKY